MNRFRDLSISTSIVTFITFIVFVVLIAGGITSYSIFFKTTNDVVETTSREINKQIIMNYENYIFDVINVADFITEISLEYTEQDDLEYLLNSYKTMEQVNQYISTISLLDLQGNPVVTRTDKIINQDLDSTDWFLSTLTDSSIYHFSAPHRENVYINGSHQVIDVSKEIAYFDNGIEKKGVLVIELEVTNFDELSEKTNLGENGHIVIIDENYNTVFTNNVFCYDSSCQSIEYIRDIILGGRFVEVDNTQMYVNVNTISLTRWRIATFINADQVVTAKKTMIISMSVAIFISFVVTVLVSSLFSKRITSPIYVLNDYMKKFQKGSLESKTNIKGQKELRELGESFNNMIDEIASLMDEVMTEQRAKRKTQFISLQNQINPHFLYNTLDSILWLNENKRNEDVSEMIVALSKFFRASISSETSIIPLSDEIEHVKNYLLIQQIRYHNRFTYQFEVDPSLLSFHVLKLGLQPIVENAIYHGINPEEDTNHIHIRAYRKDRYVYLEVQNNGYGMSPKDIETIMEGLTDKDAVKHIGLKNISQRLQLYYGKKSKIEIESKLDEYTIVRLRFPISEENNL